MICSFVLSFLQLTSPIMTCVVVDNSHKLLCNNSVDKSVCLSVLALMGIWIVSSFELLQIILLLHVF